MKEELPASDQDISLASLLNVLWRRRLLVLGLPALGLVVGLLYGVFGTRRWEATVTIRPGITAFSPEGGPLREWRLKDITRWYEKRLYERELVRRLGLPAGSRVVIQTEYVAQSLQDMAGGEVITLWTTATAPELAAAILDTSLVLFQEFAESDTIGSQIKLTRDGLQLQVRRQKEQIRALDGDKQRLDLQIVAAQAESLLILAEDERLRLDLDRLTSQQTHQEARLAMLQDEEPRLAADLTQLDHAMRRLTTTADGRQEPAEVPGWLRRDAVLDSGSVLESLTRAKLQVQQALTRNRAQQDSLVFAAEATRLDRAKLEIHRERSIRAKLHEAHRKIGDLQVELNVDLPLRRQGMQTDLSGNEVKLATVSPLQRVGATVTSEKPVRPRPRRAIAILVLLGGAAGVVLGFVWDYLAVHRREIFRS